MQLEFYQDITCPWCRIARGHLAQALREWDGAPVDVVYRAFSLNPHIPPQGYPYAAYMQSKNGGRADLERMFSGPRELGAAMGMRFHEKRIQRAPNTLLAHRLLAISPPEDKDLVLDGLYTAYFEEGEDIGRLDTLLNIAARYGHDREQVRTNLEGEGGMAEVEQDFERARQNNVQSVPYFMINERIAFGGAQLPEVIVKVLRKAERQGSEEVEQ